MRKFIACQSTKYQKFNSIRRRSAMSIQPFSVYESFSRASSDLFRRNKNNEKNKYDNILKRFLS